MPYLLVMVCVCVRACVSVCVCMCACVVTHMLTTLSNGMAETDTTTLPRAYTTDRLRMVLHTHRGRDERKTNRMMPIIHTTTAERNTEHQFFLQYYGAST